MGGAAGNGVGALGHQLLGAGGNQPSPTGTRGILENGISLLLVPFCILGTTAPAAIIVAKSWLCE